jgi:trehalose-6-phosphatase
MDKRSESFDRQDRRGRSTEHYDQPEILQTPIEKVRAENMRFFGSTTGMTSSISNKNLERISNMTASEFEEVLDMTDSEFEKAFPSVSQYERQCEMQRKLQRETIKQIPDVANRMSRHMSKHLTDPNKDQIYDILIDHELSQARERAKQNLEILENYSEVESNMQTKREAIEKNTPNLTNMYTENNTLKLSLEDYIKKAGKAKQPKIFERTTDKDKMLKNTADWNKTLNAFLEKGPETKALFLDFDGTMARFTTTPQATLAVHGFLLAVKTFLDKGYKVAIITGRPINEDTGVLAVLKRSGADDALIDNIDIFGSHGVEHRGPETKGEIQIRGDVAPYANPQKILLNEIQEQIKSDNKLKDLEITFEPKAVGATIHYREVEESKHQYVYENLNNILKKILPEKSANTNFDDLEDQSNEDFQKFMYNPSAMAFEIHLNPATTGIEAHKGAGVKYLVDKWKVQNAIAFGDERTDLDKLDALKELINDETSTLKTQAFVGTKHNKTPKRIIDDATIVVKGQESAAGLLLNIAEQAADQK